MNLSSRLTTVLIVFSLLVLTGINQAFAQVLPDNPGVIDPGSVSQNSVSAFDTWNISDSSGFDMQMICLGGHLNLNSSISSTMASDLDEIYPEAFSIGLSLAGVNDISSRLGVRTFFLARSVALDNAGEQEDSSLQAPVPGFRWVGDATITLLGSSKLYTSPSSSFATPGVGAQQWEEDYIDTHSSEYEYVEEIEEGTFEIGQADSFNWVSSVLDQYEYYWTQQVMPPYDFSLKFYPGTEEHTKLREDLDNRLDNQGDSMGFVEKVDGFDYLKTLVQAESSSNNYVSAMFCKPALDQQAYSTSDFFKNKYDPSTRDGFALIEITPQGDEFAMNRYRQALKAGWRVAPATSLDNTTNLDETATDYYTGVWIEVPDGFSSWDRKDYILETLKAFRNRRTFVSNHKKGSLRFYALDNYHNTAAIMGEEINTDGIYTFRVNVSRDKTNSNHFILNLRLVAVYEDESVRYFPFKGLYNDVDKSREDYDRVFEFRVNSLSNLKAVFVVCDMVEIDHTQIEDSWSPYKIIKLLKNQQIEGETRQMLSAPIFIDI